MYAHLSIILLLTIFVCWIWNKQPLSLSIKSLAFAKNEGLTVDFHWNLSVQIQSLENSVGAAQHTKEDPDLDLQ